MCIRDRVKTGYSKVVGQCFANHCDHCGSIQGNNYLFNEDSPLSTSTPVETELIERMKRLKIYQIHLTMALPLDWDMAYCSNDWAYLTYGPQFEELMLPGAKSLYPSYGEMFQP